MATPTHAPSVGVEVEDIDIPGGATRVDNQDATISPSTLAPAPPPVPLPTPPVRVSRRRWWLFGCGGSGAIAIIVVLVVVFVFVNAFSNSPLRRFPIEVGASTV